MKFKLQVFCRISLISKGLLRLMDSLLGIIFYVLSSWRSERRAQFTVCSDQLLQHRKSPQQTTMTSKVKQRSCTSQSSAVSPPADWETLPDSHSTATESFLGICRPKASIPWMDGFSSVNICKQERKANTTCLWCWPLFKFQLNVKGQSSPRFFFFFGGSVFGQFIVIKSITFLTCLCFEMRK